MCVSGNSLFVFVYLSSQILLGLFDYTDDLV